MASTTIARWLTVCQWLIVAAMFAAAALVWQITPDSIPVHFGLNGEPNRYGGKVEGLLALPLVALGVLLLLKFVPRIDPLQERHAEFATAYNVVILAIVAFLALVYAVILAAIFNVGMNITAALSILVGLLFVVIGVVIDRVSPNWFVGIRTPWTLSSERAWVATHHAGRPVFVGMGVALVLAGLIQTTWALYVAIAICVLGGLGLIAYSYVVWRQDPTAHT
jgi:uncharacterized membrane protein